MALQAAGPAPRAASPPAAATQRRAEALRVARQFEEVLVQTLVHSLRQSAQLGGEGGGMFGTGPGADTYAEWFDQHLAGNLTEHGGIGIADVLMREFERWGQIPAPPPRPVAVPAALPLGGFDVVA